MTTRIRPLATTVTMQSAAVATGNGTAVNVAAGGYVTLVAQVTGITTATITWEATIDDSTWVAIRATDLTSGTAASTATANGLFSLTVSGLSQVRARISAYTSGTITVTGKAVAA